MRKRDAKSPKCDLVHGRVVNVVCAVQSDDGAESGPGAKGAGAEGSDARGRGAGVDLLGAGEGEVGLDAVAERDDGNLDRQSWSGFGLFGESVWRQLRDVRRGATWAGSRRRGGGRM